MRELLVTNERHSKKRLDSDHEVHAESFSDSLTKQAKGGTMSQSKSINLRSDFIRLWIVTLTTVTLTVSATASFAQVAPTPPFHQCPSVGADTGCAILLDIDKTGSLRVFNDPTQGPYDTIEDTLVGVQNDSENPIASIPLSGPDIFGFDGDGICGLSPITGQPFVPAPGACPFGPTGYEGPDTSFSTASVNSGVVNFPTNLASNTSAYFSLEGAIQTKCPPINAPAPLSQDDPQWANTVIGTSTVTIGDYGCFLTDVAMEVNFYAAKQGSAFRTDPKQLDAYLTPLNAFDPDGNLLFSKLPLIQTYAASHGVTVFFSAFVDSRNDFTLDQYLCNAQPPMLQVGTDNAPHWVLATGQATQQGTITYSDIDPDDYANGNSLAGYPAWNNTYSQMLLFSDTASSLSGLYIEGHSPIEFVLTAPDGSQTGYDPLTKLSLNSIPSSGYGNNQLVNDHTKKPPLTKNVKELVVNGPTIGTYTLQIFGTGTGPYTIDFTAYDENGTPSTQTITGHATPSTDVSYAVQYSSIPGSNVTVSPLPPSGMLSILPKKLNFGTVALNKSKLGVISIVNRGKVSKKSHPASVTITTETITGSSAPSPFSLLKQCSDQVLPPRGKGVQPSATRCTVTVQFAPTEAISYSGSLNIFDASEPNAVQTIPLTGKGKASKKTVNHDLY
jgi:hypothetical protein